MRRKVWNSTMNRRSLLTFLAALPFLPKLFGKQKEALTGESAEPKFVPQATRVSPRRRYYNPDDMPSTSGTYSDAVTYQGRFVPGEGFVWRRSQWLSPAPSEPLG